VARFSERLPGEGPDTRRFLSAALSRGWRVFPLILLLLASGCASYGVVHNEAESGPSPDKPYSLKTWRDARGESDFVFILAFSGGGTRAAAMAYGVLQQLRDTPVVIDGKKSRLLDHVTHISSVSGGSFTSAYYGLYGDRIFEDFEDQFLRRDVEKHLTDSLLEPTHWFSRKGRTERAMDYYNKILFNDLTFADMMKPGRPMIIINSSDLAYGVRFSFIQDYFNLLCSNLLDLPVATAVTASSAVPVVFNPVVLENYGGCGEVTWPETTLAMAKQSDELRQTLIGLDSYREKEHRKYIHFVDGGITDNMGLRAITDVIAISGGPGEMVSQMQKRIPSRIVVLSVNASTEHRSDMDETMKQPSMLAAMNAVTDVQLHRYNAATVDTVKNDMETWTRNISTPDHPVESYFIEVSFEQVKQNELKLFLNKIPTSFSLEQDQVNALISSAKSLLQKDPEFQRLIEELSGK
jgi:NTE family protein